ncbi:hypothetical protein WJX81_003960 [Elliptochloris bilobata]|uniref:cysteine desulfurase n=1 Tax=Elliptochloris bilobata TaxID=381761 RepID=A0AAW1S3E2_9CHLO
MDGRASAPTVPPLRQSCQLTDRTHRAATSPRTRRRARKTAAAVESPAAELSASPAALGAALRGDFPILHQTVNGRPLVYLDNGATSQKPEVVLHALDEYNRRYNSNVHRGVHYLAAKATTAYEEARDKVARLVNARSGREVVFTRNATEGINLVAQSWGNLHLRPGDEVLVSVAEHHSNLVPWQLACQRTGATLRHVPLTPDTQELDMQAFKQMLSSKTKVVALVAVSNMLGCILDTSYVAEEAHRVGARLLLDCCQSVPNMPVDVQAMGADWIVASAHKMSDVLEAMPPFMGGGEMIEHVGLDVSTYAPPPSRFEPGTPPIAEAIGMGAAAEYLGGLGLQAVRAYEEDIGRYLYERLSAVPGVTVYGPPPSRGRAALCSFNVKGLHATDVSTLLDHAGVAVRSGHHCTQPLHAYLGINASARASPYIYNTEEEIDTFIIELEESISFFRDA